MMLSDVVEISASLAATRSRTAKVRLVATALQEAGGPEVNPVASYLAGVLPQRRVGLGHQGLRRLPEPAAEPTLSVVEVHDRLQAIADQAGSGSSAGRAALVRELFSAATQDEQRYLAALISGTTRQGALDGIMVEAIAAASGIEAETIRRAVMLAGHTAVVAVAARLGGADRVAAFRLEAGRPLRPMLAATAPDLTAAFTALSASGDPVAVECKLDGIRIQAHKRGDEVRVFTRTLDDITERLPEVVEVIGAVRAEAAVFDGEAVALRPDGRPHPFQVTGARTASRRSVETLRATTPLTTYLFDVLHVDGADLLDTDLAARALVLRGIAPEGAVVPRVITTDLDEAQAFFAEVVHAGHEGVVVKDLARGYAAGRRGSGWVKVKPRHTLDLVVLAVEWGSGRRSGYLSNIHLGARDPSTGGFVMLGKTFKGMTDAMLDWQTKRFAELETSRTSYVVWLRPEQVVEIAFDSLQASTRYPGGLALRFARVLRYRDDKIAAQADTIDTVRALHAAATSESNPASTHSAPSG